MTEFSVADHLAAHQVAGARYVLDLPSGCCRHSLPGPGRDRLALEARLMFHSLALLDEAQYSSYRRSSGLEGSTLDQPYVECCKVPAACYRGMAGPQARSKSVFASLGCSWVV